MVESVSEFGRVSDKGLSHPCLLSIRMLERSTIHLFRDCLRLAGHIGGSSPKGLALKKVVSEGFKKHKNVADKAEIEKLRADATRALSNYLVMKSLDRKTDSDRGL